MLSNVSPTAAERFRRRTAISTPMAKAAPRRNGTRPLQRFSPTASAPTTDAATGYAGAPHGHRDEHGDGHRRQRADQLGAQRGRDVRGEDGVVARRRTAAEPAEPVGQADPVGYRRGPGPRGPQVVDVRPDEEERGRIDDREQRGRERPGVRTGAQPTDRQHRALRRSRGGGRHRGSWSHSEAGTTARFPALPQARPGARDSAESRATGPRISRSGRLGQIGDGRQAVLVGRLLGDHDRVGVFGRRLVEDGQFRLVTGEAGHGLLQRGIDVGR